MKREPSVELKEKLEQKWKTIVYQFVASFNELRETVQSCFRLAFSMVCVLLCEFPRRRVGEFHLHTPICSVILHIIFCHDKFNFSLIDDTLAKTSEAKTFVAAITFHDCPCLIKL